MVADKQLCWQQPANRLLLQSLGIPLGRGSCQKRRHKKRTSADKIATDFAVVLLVMRQARDVDCRMDDSLAPQRRVSKHAMRMRVSRPHEQLRNQARRDHDRNLCPIPVRRHKPGSPDLSHSINSDLPQDTASIVIESIDKNVLPS
jgi:hypothetical protein